MDIVAPNLEKILEDRNRIWLHILFWVFIYLDQILSLLGITPYADIQPFNVLATFIIDALSVYFNLYILIGMYLLPGKIWRYIAFTVITIFINIEFKFLLAFNFFETDISRLPDSAVASQLISDFVFTSFMLGTAIGAHFLRRNIFIQKRMRILETEKLSTELEFLKNQINPHFLFNSLNNIYVQTRTRPRQASESILLLSDLLRYQLYDCAQEEVKLKHEIQYLQNYLELEKLRRGRANISYNLNGSPKDYKIAPFLFIPFVENAVKHGSSNGNGLYIDIQFEIKNEIDEISFSIRNTKNGAQPKKSRTNKKSGGIGLKNVKRRLELIYPKKHKLQISNKAEEFSVELTINLN
jgi:sensor histidine kinase YesM